MISHHHAAVFASVCAAGYACDTTPPRNDQPEIPTDHYSYLEFELEQAGSLAAMIGVTTSCDLDRGPLQVVVGGGQ